MAIKEMYYTDAGQKADAESAAVGEALVFSKVEIGKNFNLDINSHEMVTPIGERVSYNPSKIEKKYSENNFIIQVDVENKEVESSKFNEDGYYPIKEIALYCISPKTKEEIVYCYGKISEEDNTNDNVEKIPKFDKEDANIVVHRINIVIAFGRAEKEIRINDTSYEDRVIVAEDNIVTLFKPGFVIYNQETFNEWVNDRLPTKRNFTTVKIVENEEKDDNGNPKAYELMKSRTDNTIDLDSMGTKNIKGYGNVIINADIGYPDGVPQGPAYIISNIKLGERNGQRCKFVNCRLLFNCEGECEGCKSYQDDKDTITDGNIKDWEDNYVKFLHDNDALMFVVEKEDDITLPTDEDKWNIISKEYIKEEI